ncbi:hypothetical protein K3495_g8339 [Podosphaera aphanis]|nr:hypothetical protein K3495_g8339 [Podosphaera aphanis]
MSLLRTLHPFENVVENFMSKDRITFADVNKRLLDIQSSRSSTYGDSKAYSVKEKPFLNEKKKSAPGASQGKRNTKDINIQNAGN